MHTSISGFFGFWAKMWQNMWDANHFGLQVFDACAPLFLPLQDYTVEGVTAIESGGYRIDVRVDTAGDYLGTRMSFWSPIEPAKNMWDENGQRVYKIIKKGTRFGIRFGEGNQGRDRHFFYIEDEPTPRSV